MKTLFLFIVVAFSTIQVKSQLLDAALELKRNKTIEFADTSTANYNFLILPLMRELGSEQLKFDNTVILNVIDAPVENSVQKKNEQDTIITQLQREYFKLYYHELKKDLEPVESNSKMRLAKVDSLLKVYYNECLSSHSSKEQPIQHYKDSVAFLIYNELHAHHLLCQKNAQNLKESSALLKQVDSLNTALIIVQSILSRKSGEAADRRIKYEKEHIKELQKIKEKLESSVQQITEEEKSLSLNYNKIVTHSQKFALNLKERLDEINKKKEAAEKKRKEDEAKDPFAVMPSLASAFGEGGVIPGINLLGKKIIGDKKGIYGEISLFTGLATESYDGLRNGSALFVNDASTYGLSTRISLLIPSKVDTIKHLAVNFGLNLLGKFLSPDSTTSIRAGIINLHCGGEVKIFRNIFSIYGNAHLMHITHGVEKIANAENHFRYRDKWEAYFQTGVKVAMPVLQVTNTIVQCDFSYIWINNNIRRYYTGEDRAIPVFKLALKQNF